MENTDTYNTIAAPSTGVFKDRGSKFVAYAFPVKKEEDCHRHLAEIRKEHPKARHWCYAYRLGLDGHLFRANDDGEPSGTAGKPILGRIDSFGLTNIFIVVVRYFGGTLLGASGLINAYKTTAELALQESRVITKIVTDSYRLQFDYALMGEVMNVVKKLELEIIEQQFDTHPYLIIGIRQSEIADTLLKLKALIGKLHPEEAAKTESIEGLVIEKIV